MSRGLSIQWLRQVTQWETDQPRAGRVGSLAGAHAFLTQLFLVAAADGSEVFIGGKKIARNTGLDHHQMGDYFERYRSAGWLTDTGRTHRRARVWSLSFPDLTGGSAPPVEPSERQSTGGTTGGSAPPVESTGGTTGGATGGTTGGSVPPVDPATGGTTGGTLPPYRVDRVKTDRVDRVDRSRTPAIPSPDEHSHQLIARAAAMHQHLVELVGELSAELQIRAPRLSATPGGQHLRNCGLVAACETYSDAELHHVLAVRAAQARAERSLDWLDGHKTWLPKALTWALPKHPDDFAATSKQRAPYGGMRVL